MRFVSRFIDIDRIPLEGEQGRRDSNPQPPVLETGALPIELLPSGRGWAGPRYTWLRASPQPGRRQPAATRSLRRGGSGGGGPPRPAGGAPGPRGQGALSPPQVRFPALCRPPRPPPPR